MHGLNGEILVDIMMFVVQFSCCVGYLYFISDLMETLICNYTGTYCNN